VKPTVYVETSVISYASARISRNPMTAFRQRLTKKWWEEILPQVASYLSPVVLDEISRGNKEESAKRLERASVCNMLEYDSAIDDLAIVYLGRIQIPRKAEADAYHVAYASYVPQKN